jgi:IMP dehydrogenase
VCSTVGAASAERRDRDAHVEQLSGVCAAYAEIIAGNVCTAAATKALLDAGADVIKVNIGPGAMCTTRMRHVA